ncbi:hypothetical protein GF345_02365 [Candidatus Woesearchaeota archaeon]|nr:hypothetical protein [Candidatus Woesearchaeota archaeon]
MDKMRLSREERLGRIKEARKGWVSKKDMSALGYSAFREGREKSRKKSKEEKRKQKEEDIQKRKEEAEQRKAESRKESGEKKRGKGLQRAKLLILVLVIVALVYIILNRLGYI